MTKFQSSWWWCRFHPRQPRWLFQMQSLPGSFSRCSWRKSLLWQGLVRLGCFRCLLLPGQGIQNLVFGWNRGWLSCLWLGRQLIGNPSDHGLADQTFFEEFAHPLHINMNLINVPSGMTNRGAATNVLALRCLQNLLLHRPEMKVKQFKRPRLRVLGRLHY